MRQLTLRLVWFHVNKVSDSSTCLKDSGIKGTRKSVSTAQPPPPPILWVWAVCLLLWHAHEVFSTLKKKRPSPQKRTAKNWKKENSYWSHTYILAVTKVMVRRHQSVQLRSLVRTEEEWTCQTTVHKEHPYSSYKTNHQTSHTFQV